jgi:hypothetical protein
MKNCLFVKYKYLAITFSMSEDSCHLLEKLKRCDEIQGLAEKSDDF